jgi:phosphoenolpyruvate synthase/pyruvate phosphate dikinase
LLDQLALLKVEDRDKIGELSREIRRAIEAIVISEDIAEEIAGYLTKFGETDAFAVRSSATAEDLPTASFAGPAGYVFEHYRENGNPKAYQQVLGIAIYERAVIYRLQNGFDHRKVSLSVVVQQDGFPAGGRDFVYCRPRYR